MPSIWRSSEKMLQPLEALMIQTSSQILKHLACKAGVVSNRDKMLVRIYFCDVPAGLRSQMTGLLMSDWWSEQTAAGPEEPAASDMVVPKPGLQLLAWQGNSRPTVPEVVRNRPQIAIA